MIETKLFIKILEDIRPLYREEPCGLIFHDTTGNISIQRFLLNTIDDMPYHDWEMCYSYPNLLHKLVHPGYRW